LTGALAPEDPNATAVLLATAVLELVDNDCTNNNATLDNLLPEGRHIHQIKGIVQYTDNQRTNNRACNCPDSTSRKGGTTNHRGRNGIKFVANAKPRLPPNRCGTKPPIPPVQPGKRHTRR